MHTPMSLRTSSQTGVAILTSHVSLRTSAHAGVAIPQIFRQPKDTTVLSPHPVTASPCHRCPSREGLAIPQPAWHLTAPFTQGSHSTIQPKLSYARDCTQGHSLRSSRQCAHCLAMTKVWVRHIAQAYFSMTEVSWGSSCCFRERSPWWKVRSAVGSSGKASLPQAVRLPPK